MTFRIHATDGDVLAALKACDEADRDGLGGGWHPSVVADGERYGTHAAKTHLDSLCDAGDVVRVQGVGPNGPRDSYLPADHEDAPTDDGDDGPDRRVWVDEHDA